MALLAAGCGSNPVPPPVMAHGVAAREPLVDPRPYGTADTALGLDVLGAYCRADPRANLVLSPSSLASGLGLAYLGARGGTARAMAGVLHLPAAGGQALEAGLQARSAALRGLGGPGVTLDASDQVWADPGLPTERSYLNAVATGYDAGLAKAPLLKDPEQARQEINQAIATATRGQIPHLLASGSLDNHIGWVLTDALYLHAAWATPFDPDETGPGPFTTAAGRPVTAQFMLGGQYRAVSAGGWTAVWLPYRGGKLAMEALLPPAGPAGCTLPAAAALGAMTSRLASGQPGTLTRSVVLPEGEPRHPAQHEARPHEARHGRRVHPGGGLHRAVAAGVLHRPGGAFSHPGHRREGHGGQRRDRGRRGGERRAGAAAPGQVRPSLPDGGDRPRDRRAPVHGPGRRPHDTLRSEAIGLGDLH